jgi:hypothetical protein
MKTILIVLIALVAIGIAGAWPMENGAVQLSKVSLDEVKQMDNGLSSSDMASVGPTKGMLAFLEIGDAGKPIGNVTGKAPLRCGKGLVN